MQTGKNWLPEQYLKSYCFSAIQMDPIENVLTFYSLIQRNTRLQAKQGVLPWAQKCSCIRQSSRAVLTMFVLKSEGQLHNLCDGQKSSLNFTQYVHLITS